MKKSCSFLTLRHTRDDIIEMRRQKCYCILKSLSLARLPAGKVCFSKKFVPLSGYCIQLFVECKEICCIAERLSVHMVMYVLVQVEKIINVTRLNFFEV